jgi:hypothetical protein
VPPMLASRTATPASTADAQASQPVSTSESSSTRPPGWNRSWVRDYRGRFCGQGLSPRRRTPTESHKLTLTAARPQ